MITRTMLTPMLQKTNAEIDAYLAFGLYGLNRRQARTAREYRREECHYDRYADDWEREGDD
ncbi:MAG: hypothetical protein IJM68_01095 [Synergistaceae bacterium]|nr:hypothetical protein [Synergistaceae bacterium]